MKKIIFVVLAVLAAAALLFGCQKAGTTGTEQSGEPSVSESDAQGESEPEESQSEPEQSESEKEKLLPPVEGPDENGKFPAISKDAYEKYIMYSDPVSGQAERPSDSEITPFLEDKFVQKYLKEKFPNISDWKTVFEDHRYWYDSYAYDPYTYSYGDGYCPYYTVILATEQGGSFDRFFLTGHIYIDFEYDESEDAYIPQYVYSGISGKTTEEYLQCGDFSGARYISQPGEGAIWVPEVSTTLHIEYNRLLRVRVKDADAPLSIEHSYDSEHWYFADYVKTAKPPESRSGDALLVLEQGNDEYMLAYYDSSEQAVADFENITYNKYYSFSFVTDTLLSYNDIVSSAYYFYDFSDGADPTKCILALYGNGGELNGGAFSEFRVYDALADRKDDDRYMLIYADTDSEKFYIAYFSIADGLLTQITLDESPEGYIGDHSVRGGIAYISYNDGNGFKHYAVDLRPDKDHTIQENAW